MARLDFFSSINQHNFIAVAIVDERYPFSASALGFLGVGVGERIKRAMRARVTNRTDGWLAVMLN